MKAIFSVASSVVLMGAFTVSSCASMNADPCSRAGIEARMKPSLKDFARSNRADLNEVKKAASYLEGETTFGAMRLAFAVTSLKRMADDFEETVVPDITEITQQCGADAPLKGVFIDFLKDEGVNSKVIKWVEAFNFTFETDEPA
eukprot:GHVR01127479.1.p1 GENE.GHVR01127479.1~~GHVR01127479.1.p1  ORF type:complete len:145 (-),score=24.66 GHVR01127479.1:337-771(-)